jgi:hypothetical protein
LRWRFVSAARLLGALHNVKPAGPDRWAAGCPCCQSKRGRPVSVRQTGDGRVLIHAFCGCTTESVLGALGLQLSDLFDAPLGHHLPPASTSISARDLLSVVSHEVDVAAILLAQVADGKSITEDEWQRVAQAAARIGQARGHING